MSPRITLAALLLIPILPARLAAQTVLMAEDDGKPVWVRAARLSDPCIEVDGKIKPILADGFALKDVSEFLPVFVSVKNIKVGSKWLNTASGAEINREFQFYATFESMYALKDVFLVLDLTTESGVKHIFLEQVGDMDPNKERSVDADVPISEAMGKGKYKLHIYSQGVELLQSEIPFGVREAALDRMVAKRIKDVHSQAPRLFVAANPEYPPSLVAANLKGQAMVAFRIGPNGAVYNPVVKSATDPAFGDAALAAVRIWRFLPAVKDDAAVGIDVVVPVVFDSPKPTKA
jgi:TonB family protein